MADEPKPEAGRRYVLRPFDEKVQLLVDDGEGLAASIARDNLRAAALAGEPLAKRIATENSAASLAEEALRRLKQVRPFDHELKRLRDDGGGLAALLAIENGGIAASIARDAKHNRGISLQLASENRGFAALLASQPETFGRQIAAATEAKSLTDQLIREAAAAAAASSLAKLSDGVASTAAASLANLSDGVALTIAGHTAAMEAASERLRKTAADFTRQPSSFDARQRTAMGHERNAREDIWNVPQALRLDVKLQ